MKVEPLHRLRTALEVVVVAAMMHACDGSRDDSGPAADSSPAPTTSPLADVRCYRSPQSVLLGPPVGRRNVGHPPGWLRLEGLDHATSGVAELVDANRAGLSGQWMREGDSLRVLAADDFLRTELRVVVGPSSLRGRASARSDADLERDSTGRLAEVRREWQVAAVRVACDSMPRRPASGNP
ncbi:MAG TPA: hypothetical protein VJ596_02095 [Gemmatimonadaceae bacterium]|nr:hypothetical protein [Gemmatimonadaceae bacterium]